MSYRINLGQWNSVFAVPSSVVDKHLRIASEAQIKVLLYALRHSDDSLTADAISEMLKISVEEVQNAFEFWIDRELFSAEKGILAPTDKRMAESPAAPQPDVKPDPPQKPRTAVSRAQRPDPAYVAKLLKEDTYLAGLLEETQTVLKKPLSPGDTATLVMLYDTFGLPCEVIAMMVNYLAETGNANMRAIERTGIQWADNGIKTVSDAEKEIERRISSRKAWGRVSSLLGIRNIGNPTKSQMEHADRWLNIWQFSDEMITEAYERCVNTKGEYNIRYINAILQKWYEKSIKSLDTLHAFEANAQKKPSAKNTANKKGSMFSLEGASFDIAQYENDSLFDD